MLDVARELYPSEWQTLVPRLVSLASWVGYDHDGRSDIGWADTLRMRLKSKHAQLVRQKSKNACRFNQSWGYDSRGVWVSKGCRAQFAIY